MIKDNRIAIEYCGREYRVQVYPSTYGDGDDSLWDAIASFPKGDAPDPEEYEAFEKYLEDEGFIEQLMKYWNK